MGYETLIRECVQDALDSFRNPFVIVYITRYSETTDKEWYVTFSKPVRPSVPIRGFRKVVIDRFKRQDVNVKVEVIDKIKVRDSILITIK